MPVRRARGRVAGVLVVAIGLGIVASGRPLLTVLLALVTFAVCIVGIGAVASAWEGTSALRRFRRAWPDRDLLLVYSASPLWKDRVEREWLPRWGARAVVLDWSDRARWAASTAPEAALFRAVAGRREHTPMAIVIPPRGPVRVVRFWRAFRDAGHGRDATLRAAEAELARLLDELPRRTETEPARA